MHMKTAEVGIITFHCADNVGAMLQAYGMKYFLHTQGINAEIVRYEPPFMTGRHWRIPYIPLRTWRGALWAVRNLITGTLFNLRNGKNFSGRRANMNRFRQTYLVSRTQQVFLSSGGLKKLSYRFYVIGSDQIWNPDTTCGLRKVYFGAFRNRKREKTIIYGASLGSSSIPEKFDRKFSDWISFATAVSLRETSSLPYVRKHYTGSLEIVLDPVFLPPKDCWQELEKSPCKKGYLLLYITEPNPRLRDCAKKLARAKGLFVVSLCSFGREPDEALVLSDFTAGPSEFLGYLHHADYVMTNSFHATAFSIIYEKKFIVFPHSTLNERLTDILTVHGLKARMYHGDGKLDIDTPIDWEMVRQKKEQAILRSRNFLLENLRADSQGKDELGRF